ncbi:uncharacterized protein LOC103514439, partial [Diaphorina citri]|uniref:Uncharacterized protein LOC103514439 n=1 Tax=Diaphorina citri TaxID=121845 RepID=A0A3Q0J460_DIACI
KLSDNNLTLYKNSFRGLELSLKNLNLKNTKLKSVPECIKGLKSLTFLDLAQNLLTQLPGNNMGIFKNLNSLTALNLERNILQELNENAFLGVEDTLSSLSLLNNLLTEFPTKAINTLRELRMALAWLRHLNTMTSHFSPFHLVTLIFLAALIQGGSAQCPWEDESDASFATNHLRSFQECIVVCVISLEDINVTPETVPYPQCREVRTTTSPTNHMDKITIAASAAICGTVLIAVIIFIAASRRRSRKLDTLQAHHNGKVGIPVCCPTHLPKFSLCQTATLNAYNTHKDWDQMSMYSNRSRMYHIERPGSVAACNLDDLHSHLSHFSSKPQKKRSLADGQSQNSFSNASTRFHSNAFASGLISSRPELRQSRQSLAAASDRMSRLSYQPGPGGPGGPQSAMPAGARRQRTRSRTREGASRPGSRYSIAGSTHTLNNYCGGDTSDNWTDHDMDIYMTRNPTARNGMM